MKKIGSHLVRLYTMQWKPFSRLFLLSDSPLWSIARDMEELACICRSLKIDVPIFEFLSSFCDKQCLFFGSHFNLLMHGEKWLKSKNRLAVAYFHGKPNSDNQEFKICYENLTNYHHRIRRVQVSYSGMKDIILESGISSEKVFLIPIAVNLGLFSFKDSISRERVRQKFGIPQSAVVIGSFQKDGVGWKEGNEPKLIKGPDIFLKSIEILKISVPGLFVLLSGPARGYLKKGLARLKVPFVHVYQKSYADIAEMYHALDLYLVSSREEGGPKAVLESMASGVPLVTTRVGQGMDLVRHGENGWIVDIEDYEALAYWGQYALQAEENTKEVSLSARKTAEANSYETQIPRWSAFFKDFVD